MATIHFILQGKGGVGKSMIASLLYQALLQEGKEVQAFDTDPVNSTLAGYREFNVTRIEILKGGDIDPRKFDALFEGLVSAPAGSHVIVDNGASSFVALAAYIQQNDVLPVLNEEGHKVFFHTVITGGQAIVDTTGGLARLAMSFNDVPLIVWLNPFFGEIELDGKKFEEFKVYQEYSSLFKSIIHLPDLAKTTYGKDLEELFAKRQTFEVGIKTSGIAIRTRLRRYWEEVFNQIKEADIFGE
ncbi:MAG: conjugal transfer protein TraL [Desulfovibrio sp.]|nr:conjugal transfer protein TraL [Desulfovibrio sp.]